MPESTRKSTVSPLLIFVLSFLVYVVSPVMTPTDSRYATQVAYNVLKHGSTRLDRYNPPRDDYRIVVAKDHTYTLFSVWATLLLVPGVALTDWIVTPLLEHFPALENLVRSVGGGCVPLSHPLKTYELYPVIELVTSSLLCAASVAIFSMIAGRYLPRRRALWATAVFALATPMWSTVSRALWSHSPSVLMLTITLWLLVEAKDRPARIAWAGATVALAFMFRPTNSVTVVLVSVYVLLNYRRYFLRYVLAALPLACLYVGYNVLIQGHIFDTYVSHAHLGKLAFHRQFLQALAANWVSPARGLLIFSPVLILAIVGLWKERRDSLVKLICAMIVAHWIVVSMNPPWWAGYAFGPRFFSDMIPLFGYGLILWFQSGALDRHTTVKAFAIVATAVSILIHANGAVNLNAFMWSANPYIDDHVERVWDWSDPQFLRIK
jgi:hypothetical protein